MDHSAVRQLVTVFVSVFLAEVGDKTQLATLLFAADPSGNRLGVFAAASAALVSSTLLAVVAGDQVTRLLSPGAVRTAAGLGFLAIGLWMLVGGRS